MAKKNSEAVQDIETEEYADGTLATGIAPLPDKSPAEQDVAAEQGVQQEGESIDDIARCEICGEPMPEGEEMFKFHGYSGDCPKPPLKQAGQQAIETKEYSDGTTATGVAPLPDQSPAQQDAAAIEKAIQEQKTASAAAKKITPPLVEAEAILAWLKTQPSTSENKTLRAYAVLVVEYLKAK